MEIIKYDDSKKDWTLFRRKRGQRNFEWQEVGSNILNADGLIDMTKFYESEGYTVFDSADDFIEFSAGDDFFLDLLKMAIMPMQKSTWISLSNSANILTNI